MKSARRTAGAHPRGPRRRSTCWCSTCGCRTPAASSWCARSGRSTAAGCRSWSSAGPSPRAAEVRISPRSASPGYVNEYSAVQQHPAVARAAPLPRQLQPARQPARGAGHPGRLPLRQHDRGRADAEPEQGRRGDPDDEPARAACEGARPLPPAGIEDGHRSRLPRRLERSPRRDGPAVREGRIRPTRPRSTSSSISISSPTGRRRPASQNPDCQIRTPLRSAG